jgi:DNA primase
MRVDFAEVKRRFPIARVLSVLGAPKMRTEGGRLRGPCPVCEPRATNGRRFSADAKRGGWKCFGCGGKGSALDLFRLATGLPLKEAAVELCRRGGEPVPYLETRGRPRWGGVDVDEANQRFSEARR